MTSTIITIVATVIVTIFFLGVVTGARVRGLASVVLGLLLPWTGGARRGADPADPSIGPEVSPDSPAGRDDPAA